MIRLCAQSGCGTVVLVEDQSAVQSPNYPQSYSHGCVVRWVVYAPQGHVVKVIPRTTHQIPMHDKNTTHWSNWSELCVMFQLDFVDFDLEESDTCLYDSLTVLGDVGGAEEIGRKCRSSFIILTFCLCLSPLSF